MNIKGHQFYNKDRKEKYLNTLQNEREKIDLAVAFNQISSLEKQFNVDISDADQSTLMMILRLWEVSSYCRYKRFIKLIEKYVEYEVESGNSLQTYNVFAKAVKQVKYNVDASIYSNYVRDPEDLLTALTNIFGYSNIGSRYVFHIAFLVLLYNGFDNKEILELNELDIDKDNQTIKGIKIYDVFWKPIINAFLTKTVVFKRGQVIDAPPHQYSHIIKSAANDFIKVVREDLYRNKQKAENIPKGLSFSTIKMSGKWFKFYMDEQIGIMPWDKLSDFTDYKNYKKAYWT